MQTENNKSIKTDPELTQMLKLADKDIKTVVTSVLNIFKKLSRDMEDIKDANQIKFHKIKTSEMKVTLDVINRLKITKEKVSELEKKHQ